jgi:two-component system NtrC family response regulator
MGEQVDTDDNSLDRSSTDHGELYRADEPFPQKPVIKSDIAWKGPEGSPINPRFKPFGGNHARRSPAALRGEIPLESIVIGSSPQAIALREQIRLYSVEPAPVLISGETGVGKELVARELHRLSERRDARFVALNASAIPETLAAAELFGHTKGAFTGAIAERDGAFVDANGGALFLDEIGDMPLSVQTHLLRVLDDGLVTKIGARASTKVDFRLVAATHVDLKKEVGEGRFRRDLFYRINVLAIDVAPLRERGDDVIEIAEHIIRTQPNRAQRGAGLTPNAADRLKAHRFPGNIRELRNVITRALVHARGGKILVEHLSFADGCAEGDASSAKLDVGDAKDLVTRFLVLKALKKANGNVSKAAELAGRSRSTVHALKRQLPGEDFATEYEAACAQLRALIDDC